MPKRKNDLVWREIDGETAIISSDNKKMHMLSEVGTKIWSLMDGKYDISTIAVKIADEYGADIEVVTKDVIEYLDNLERLNLLEIK